MCVTNSTSKIFPFPGKILYVYMRLGKIWALTVSVWQQRRVRRVIWALSLLSVSLDAGSINSHCQEWPRYSHVLGIRLGMNPPTSSICTHTHTTYTHTTSTGQTHPFNVYGICRSWLGGVSSDKKVLALLKASQCWYSQRSPRAHFSDFFRCGWQHLPYSFVPSFACQKTVALLCCGHHSHLKWVWGQGHHDSDHLTVLPLPQPWLPELPVCLFVQKVGPGMWD